MYWFGPGKNLVKSKRYKNIFNLDFLCSVAVYEVMQPIHSYSIRLYYSSKIIVELLDSLSCLSNINQRIQFNPQLPFIDFHLCSTFLQWIFLILSYFSHCIQALFEFLFNPFVRLRPFFRLTFLPRRYFFRFRLGVPIWILRPFQRFVSGWSPLNLIPEAVHTSSMTTDFLATFLVLKSQSEMLQSMLMGWCALFFFVLWQILPGVLNDRISILYYRTSGIKRTHFDFILDSALFRLLVRMSISEG